MDKEHEEILVKNFFNKRIQDRILFELNSEKKRRSALDRLCHNYEKVFNEKYMIEVQKSSSGYSEILNILKSNGAKDSCYVISYNKEIDGQYMPLYLALERAVGYGMPSIISCFPNKLLYFESEQIFGSPLRFIIKKE